MRAFTIGARGSSPLTRGKQWWDWRRRGHVGLIPAHAGKTRPIWGYRPTARAHPHSCGENRKSLLPTASQYGSSPLMQGKRSSPICTAWRGAHPRSRGETLTERELVVPTLGSSPLTRGKLLDLAGRARDRGLIPAHAGKTRHVASAIRRIEGSSPLTRGKRVPRGARQGPLRLIPAHAGKT